jgi:hypothetical protein
MEETNVRRMAPERPDRRYFYEYASSVPIACDWSLPIATAVAIAISDERAR